MECTLCHYPLLPAELKASTKRGGDPACAPCWKGWEEHLAYEDDLQCSYVEAQAKRVKKQQKEHAAWKQKRYQEHLDEQREAQRRADEWRQARAQ